MAVAIDPWSRFRLVTRARIGLGRAGDGLPTTALLDFQLAHAKARDAVHGAVDFEALAADLAPSPTLRVHSRAGDRSIYLRRPDLGRRLDPESAAALRPGDWDAVVVIADGLSAAALGHAPPVVEALYARLGRDWRLAPPVLAEQARVALGDEVGERLGAAMVVVLIGERPGLSVADSLGAYITWNPVVGRRDSERNCVSNIHDHGLSHQGAAEKIAWLMTEARVRRLTGVNLKEDAGYLSGPAGAGELPPAA